MSKEADRSLMMFQKMNRVRKAWHDFSPRPGINKSQFVTLLALRHGSLEAGGNFPGNEPKPMTLSVLSGIMEQSMPAVSQRISRLEALGYVKRSQDEKDKRTVWIELTPSGLELLEISKKNMIEKIGFVMNGMGQEDTETMFRVLDKLAEMLECSDKDKK